MTANPKSIRLIKYSSPLLDIISTLKGEKVCRPTDGFNRQSLVNENAKCKEQKSTHMPWCSRL